MDGTAEVCTFECKVSTDAIVDNRCFPVVGKGRCLRPGGWSGVQASGGSTEDDSALDVVVQAV